MNLLHLDASLLGDQSASRHLGHELVEALRRSAPDMHVQYRDLALQREPVLDATLMGARGVPAADRPSELADRAAASDAVLQEFLAADVVVIGAPMYNFSIPSALKNWLDLISVAGVSFRYTAQGPVGLLTGKRVYLVSTAGGLHAGQPSGAAHEDYLKFILGFLGIDDIRVVRAEGLGMGPQARAAGMAAARRQIDELVPAEAIAA